MIPKFRVWEHDVKFMNNQVRITQNFLGIGETIVEVSEGMGWKRVDEKYLMQSTGLHDVNGIDIFEGDILKATYNTVNETKTEIKVINITGQVYKNYGCYYVDGYSFKELNNLEIIGNIHEHSDLLA